MTFAKAITTAVFLDFVTIAVFIWIGWWTLTVTAFSVALAHGVKWYVESGRSQTA